MNHTKILIVAVLVLGCLGASAARADLAMTILSETYHATGHVYRSGYSRPISEGEDIWRDVPTEYHAYDVTTSTPPAAGSLSIAQDEIYAPEAIWAQSSATRYQEGSTAFFRVEAYQSRPSYEYLERDADATARLDVQFKLSGPEDHLHAAVDMDYAWASGSLTGGGQSWQLYGLTEVYNFIWRPTDPIPIDTTQIYTLSMDFRPWWTRRLGGVASVGFSDISTVSTVPSPVPLPGAVLLGLLGLGCAGWRLRRGGC